MSSTATSQKMSYQAPIDYRNMYLDSNGTYFNYQIPLQPVKRSNIPTSTVIFTLSVLLCLFSCLLTATLSYKWHTDTNYRIDQLASTVGIVIKELETFRNIVRDELLTKHENNNYQEHTETSMDYGDEEDYEDNKFMGRSLLLNNSPLNNTVDVPREVDDRVRRSAEVDVNNDAKNNLNSPSKPKKMIEVDLKPEESEENTVRTYIRRKPKKIGTRKKNPITEIDEDDGVYEDIKDPNEIYAAAHFISDASKYNTQTHAHYHGNGRLRHPDGDFKDWTPYIWDTNINNGNNFQMKNGKIEILKSGLYYIYAQVYYSDQHDINGYYIMKNDDKALGCTTTRHRETQSDSCYTGGLTYLNTKDIVSIKGIDSERYIILDPYRSFFGLFKIPNDNIKL
ncbi:protein eiger [Adelges cooleyi]|uniref:protein eiger n=1 Tax=Adelges cooleyi TaxID=133065 RepID=UPI00217FE792|nr:protein eiger [Adelges cooleyi]